MTRPKLLLADHSITIRKVVELTFAEEGIDVTTAADSASAMQKFVEIQPDIVLVDIRLEETNGYEICKMIKEDEATKHIPVLLLVGSFEPYDQEKATQARADGFLTKPFASIRDLVARVSELLGNEADEPEPAELPEFHPTDDSDDIEHLYQSSFAKTAEIEEFETVDDLLGDAGMDDDLIEASYPIESAAREPLDQLSFVDRAEQTKEFDWSPDSMVTKSAKPIEEFNIDEAEAKSDDSFELLVPELNVPEMVEPPKIEEIAPVVDLQRSVEPTTDMIDLIVQKVVERLSDDVVREIAREAVPRIAEKMIREALAEEKQD